MSLDKAAIAANRFGLGARPGELAKISGDPRGWLLAQLKPEDAPPPALSVLPTTAVAAEQFSLWLKGLGLLGKNGMPAFLSKAPTPRLGQVADLRRPRAVAIAKASAFGGRPRPARSATSPPDRALSRQR